MVNKKRVLIVLLSIILPISLLSVFRLSGVLTKMPLPSEFYARNADAVMFEFERPNWYANFDEKTKNQYNDSIASVSFLVHVSSYQEDQSWLDYAWLRAQVNATVSKGFIYSIKVTCLPSTNSTMDIWGLDWFKQRNVNVTRIPDIGLGEYIEAVGFRKPQNCSLGFLVEWRFRDQSHRTEYNSTLVAEILHFNETAYQKYVVPICLNMTGDVGNSFDDAFEVTEGTYKGYLGRGHIADNDDYYKIWINQSNTPIQITMTPPLDSNFDLYVYGNDQTLLTSSTNEPGLSEQVTLNADAGWCYIDVRRSGGYGGYKLTISIGS